MFYFSMNFAPNNVLSILSRVRYTLLNPPTPIHFSTLHAVGYLAILFPDDASEIKVGSDPARPALNFVVGESVLAGGLEVGGFTIGLLGFDAERFLEGGHGHFEDGGFAGELQGEAVGGRLVFVLGVVSVHWNSIILK